MSHPNPSTAKAGGRPPAPAPVRYAVLTMYLGAASSVISTAGYIATWYVQDYEVANSPTFVHGDSGISVTSSPVVAWLIGLGGLVIFCTWLWMAAMCGQGRGWARVVATILLGLQIYLRYGLPSVHLGIPRVTWTAMAAAASLLLGVTAVILLWQRSSAGYFKARST
jgi:hypothetical protein